MRYAVDTVTQLCLLAIGLLIFSTLSSQQLDGVSYVVKPSFINPPGTKPTQEDQFYFRLEIDALTADTHFEVVVDGEEIVQFHAAVANLPLVRDVGPFRHSGAGGSYHEYIIRSLASTTADTLYLAEVVCGYSTDEGLNRAGYYCNGLDAGVIAQATPEGLSEPSLPEKMYIYVLLNRNSQLVEAKNFSGHFDGVSDLENYEIHAFASSFEESADFINSVMIGEPLDQADLFICHAFCGVFEVIPDCSSFDLSLQKDVRGETVYSFGDTVIFDIIVFNEGRVTAYNIEVQDNVPSGLVFYPELNSAWNNDRTSKSIDSLAVGASVSIPISLVVDASSGLIDIVNIAEIIKATSDPDKDISAFDIDSDPDNEISIEDDQDDAEIIIIENLCNSTFLISMEKEPSCPDENIVISPQVMMANEPVIFRWRYNGDVISRDQQLVLSPEEVDPFGTYQLTAIDNMGCTSVKEVPIDMIDNGNRFACYNDLNVGIDDDCQLNLTAAMFTGRNVVGINDYLIEIRDSEGNLIDENEVGGYPPGIVFEVRVINPCSGSTICWTNLHVENKSVPSFTYYNYGPHEILCTSNELTPTDYIADYNLRAVRPILTASQFEAELNKGVCAQSWEIDAVDSYYTQPSSCENIEIIRVYQVFDQERAHVLDTAFLSVLRLEVGDVILPSNVDNISCDADTDPQAVGSLPFVMVGSDSVYLQTNAEGDFEEPICGLRIKYNDELIGKGCVWGAKKIKRTWSLADWCDGSPRDHIQFLYIIDRDAPRLALQSDTIRIVTDPFLCHVEVTPSDYVNFTDNCSGSPDYISGNDMIELPIGITVTKVKAEDGCNNNASVNVVFVITESSPPVPILNQELTLGFTLDTINTDHYILASTIDAGSHDSDCGPVSVSIARWTEVDIIDRNGGRISNSSSLYNCNPAEVHDDNRDGQVSLDEIYRDKIEFCCQDIGRKIRVIVRVVDASGNEALAEAYVEITTKFQWTSCDDGDSCTVDDRQYGDCGCQGTPETRDVDRDDIIDCNDDRINMCFNGTEINVLYADLDSFLNLGAIGGRCGNTNEEAAMIAGEIYTPAGAMVANVDVKINDLSGEFTDTDGYYSFPDKEMYKRYEMLPIKDDDKLNGVTALDLVLLQEHLIGLRSITDPYQLIAADVNNDGRISGQDVIDMQKLLLGQRDEWRNNRSWRFVIKDYEWDDITKPWSYQEVNVISSLDRDMMDEDWIAIKTGDLSGDARANNQKAKGRNHENWVIEISDQKVSKGDVLSIQLRGQDLIGDLAALQLSLAYTGVQVLGITSGACEMSSDQFYIVEPESGLMNIVWTGDTDYATEDEALFSLEVIAEEDGLLSEMIVFDELKEQLAYNTLKEGSDVQLRYVQGFSGYSDISKAKMYQNQPNPFTGQTVIQFELVVAGRVEFQFYTSGGSLLHSIDEEFGVGNNAISLSHEDLQLYSGAVYYQMTYQDEKYTRTMVIGR